MQISMQYSQRGAKGQWCKGSTRSGGVPCRAYSSCLFSLAREGTEESSAFKELLEQKLKEESQVTFSRHAVERVMERSVDVSSDKLERLNEGVKLAGEKGLKAPLILMDSTAFVVNVKNNRVVTVVNEESLKGTVFTNIDGTVMV